MYGLIAVWLLFYPLAGYLADVRYGRRKLVVSVGLRMMWMGIMVLIIGGIFTDVMFGSLWGVVKQTFITAYLDCILVFIGFIGFLTCLMLSIGIVAFAANVIQLGIDQLQDFPARDSFLFIHWLLLTQYIGISVGKLVWSISIVTTFISLAVFVLPILAFLIVIPLSLCITKSRWFIKDIGIGNPYREVIQIISFARRHKVPIRRSAFTYWEDDIPSGLDLGKSKYGGPFTTEQVENVKAFFGILFILLSLGPFFTAEIAASAFLPILRHHMSNDDAPFFFNII